MAHQLACLCLCVALLRATDAADTAVACTSHSTCLGASPPWEPQTYCDAAKKACQPCNQCEKKNAVGKNCPVHCIPGLGSSCDDHHHCDQDTEFCSAIDGHENTCVACNYCQSGSNSIDKKCPEHCIPPLGAPCDGHHACDPDSEFCSAQKDHKNQCVACEFCSKGKDSIDGKCPTYCIPPVGASCDTHDHCDFDSEFCSAIKGFEKVCAPCTFCTNGKDSITGKCPGRCLPPVGTPCDDHRKCDQEAEFCLAASSPLLKDLFWAPEEHRCAPCQYCTQPKDAIGQKCPEHCIPALNTECDGHHHCDQKSEFCSAVMGHEFECLPCTYCHENKDSIDRHCPLHCIPPLKAKCDGHHHCDAHSEFCSKMDGHANECVACTYCNNGAKDSIDGKCPEQCIPPVYAPCDGHHSCDPTSEFCSNMEGHKQTCLPCNFCSEGKDAVDGKCPTRCIPPMGTHCNAHESCDMTTQFCSALKRHKNECVPCQFCTSDKDALDSGYGKQCPGHCIPKMGTKCDGHHHCDPNSEFCASHKLENGKHANKCVPCNYCRKGGDAIDGKCPLSCVPLLGAHCDHHHHCDKATEFCSMLKGHEHKCAPCNFCTKDADSVDKTCPLHCIPPLGAPCDGHHHCDGESEFCSKIDGHEFECVACNYCTSNSHSIDGKCPSHCVPPLTAPCDGHHHCDGESEFCSSTKAWQFGAAFQTLGSKTGDAKTYVCLPCNHCKTPKDSSDGKCPTHCIPPLGAQCDGHHHCDGESEFCTSKHVKGRAMQCAPCNYCVHPKDSIDHHCPRHCMPMVGSPCDTHHHCNPETEFCTSGKEKKGMMNMEMHVDEQAEDEEQKDDDDEWWGLGELIAQELGMSSGPHCAPCQFCTKNGRSVDKVCPRHCVPPLGTHCDKHHECDQTSEFCSAGLLPKNATEKSKKKHKNECLPCNFCLKKHDSVDGACPDHCLPALGTRCDGHHHCDGESEFCSLLPGHKNQCMPCNYCTSGASAHNRAVGGKCPEHCIPPLGSDCDGHHHCDDELEFCSNIKGHEHKCVSCNYCRKDSNALDGKCPSHCLLHSTSFGQACDRHEHCPPRGFCSAIPAFERKCLPCGLCTEGIKSISGTCPNSCSAPPPTAASTGDPEADAKAQKKLEAEQEDIQRQERMWRKEAESREEKLKEEELKVEQEEVEDRKRMAMGAALAAGLLCIGCMCLVAKKSEFDIKYNAIKAQLVSERQKYAKLSSKNEGEEQGFMGGDETDEEDDVNGEYAAGGNGQTIEMTEIAGGGEDGRQLQL